MEWLFILVLGAAAIILWDRTQRLERRLSELENQRSFMAPEAARPLEEPESEAESVEDIAARDVTPTAPIPASPIAAEQAASEPAEAHEPVEESSGFSIPKFDFEDIFGRRLPIWAGGIALAAGGIFLVIYAIEQGLMGPVTRVALSLVFGIALLIGAELAHRLEGRVR